VLVTLLGDVAATYIGIRTTERLISVARDNVSRQQDELEIVQHRFKAGDTSELDVFQATNVLEATRSEFSSSRSSCSRDVTRFVCCSVSRPNRWTECSPSRKGFRRDRTRSPSVSRRTCCVGDLTFGLPSSPH
jgi:hypothetical protein